MRTIKIYSTVGVSGTIETTARTLGELKPLLRQREIDYSGMKMLVGETKNELSVDEAALPEGDFKLYLMPQKTKSGNYNLEEALDALTDAEDAIAQAKEEIRAAMSSSSRVKTQSMSYEDQQAVEELRRMSEGKPSSTDRWS